MLTTSLIYIDSNNRYLMLHRTRKKNDVNKDKWIGVGGKLEPGETPYDCAIREMREETGLTARSMDYRGIVWFSSDQASDEEMHLFTCSDFEGTLLECDEGSLEWVHKKDLPKLNLWEGDYIFLRKLDEKSSFFRLHLYYKGDKLERYDFIDGE